MLLAEHCHGWFFVWPLVWLAVIVGVVWFLSRRWRRGAPPPAPPAQPTA